MVWAGNFKSLRSALDKPSSGVGPGEHPGRQRYLLDLTVSGPGYESDRSVPLRWLGRFAALLRSSFLYKFVELPTKPAKRKKPAVAESVTSENSRIAVVQIPPAAPSLRSSIPAHRDIVVDSPRNIVKRKNALQEFTCIHIVSVTRVGLRLLRLPKRIRLMRPTGKRPGAIFVSY